MSYLTLENGIPPFSKAVISFWFRVPKESAIAASGYKGTGGTPDFKLMQGIFPLVTFGKKIEEQLYLELNHEIWTYHPVPGQGPPYGWTTPYITADMIVEVDPSYIGLHCQSDGTFTLEFNLQTDTKMSFSAAAFEVTALEVWSGSDPAAPQARPGEYGNGIVSHFPYVGLSTIADRSETAAGRPEYFTVSNTEIVLEPDRWHHLLLSFDISGSVLIGTPFASSTCRLWYAIDDKDYRGAENMRPYRETGGQWGRDTLDDNALVTHNAWAWSGSDPNWEAPQYYYDHFVGLPQGSVSGMKVPSDGPLGIPSHEKFVEGIFQVELAEFQMWTGITLDTGVELNRRAFVDDGGKPVKPVGTDDDPAPAVKLLGKKPDVLLHKSSNWKIGKNTGATGIEINSAGDETIIPAGQFTPTAKIKKFKPEPALTETPTA